MRQEGLGVEGDEEEEAFDGVEGKHVQKEARSVLSVATGVANGMGDAADGEEAGEEERWEGEDRGGHVKSRQEDAVGFAHVMEGAVGAIVLPDDTLGIQHDVFIFAFVN